MKTKHGDRKHAKLSASGASRWLACTPSPVLEDGFGDQSSDYAREGTLAHELADLNLNLHFGLISKRLYNKTLKEIKAHELYSQSMPAQVEKYTDYCIEQFSAAQATTKDAKAFVERRVDFSHVVPEGFGTNDFSIIADGTVEVIDLKYGQGLKVDADNNPQLMLYAVGAIREMDLFFDMKRVRLTIVQPRLNHISSWEITVEDLEAWSMETVKPKAERAFAGKGKLVAGDHCKFCKVKPTCRAYEKLADKMTRKDFKKPELMSTSEIVDTLSKMEMVSGWISSVREYLYDKALKGETIPGFKLVAGRSNRKWIDPDKALTTLRKLGFTEDQIVNTKIKGFGDLEDLMSQDTFRENLSKFIIKPEGKPTLVPESDKRPALGIESAKEDFS